MRYRWILAAVLIIGSGSVFAVTSYGQATPKPPPPFVRPPEDEYLRQIAAARQREEQLLLDFAASGRDPRSLPRLNIEAYYPGMKSLADAVGAADLIFVGTAQGVQFAKNPSGGLPIASVTIQPREVVKGRGANPVVTLVQLGGPIPQPNNTIALAQLDTDELVLSGDELVLFAQRQADGSLRAVPGSGIYIVANGRIRVRQHHPLELAVSGLSLPEFLNRVRAEIR